MTKKDEQQKDEDAEQEDAAGSEDDGDEEEENSDLELQKRENDRREELLIREEALHAKKVSAGYTEAGQKPKVKTEDEKWAEDAKKRYEGTGIDPTPDDSPTEFK